MRVVAVPRQVEYLLNRVAAGESRLIEDLLALLADTPLYTPVSNVHDLSDSQGTNVVQVATFSRGSKKLVPTFTNEQIFREWSAGRYQCFALVGADLALSLPEGTSLAVNPGQSHYLELNRSQVKRLKSLEAAPRAGGEAAPAKQEAVSTDPIELQAAPERPVFQLHSADDLRLDDDWVPEPLFERSGLTDHLAQLLSRFPEVEEAYFQDHEDTGGQAALGLLCRGLDAERRFILFDELAELSRCYYGIAGAIDVFDDLDVRASSSWDLFKSLTPVYSRAEQEAGELPELQSSVERFRTRRTGGPWQSMRRTGSRVLNALRGDNDT